MKVLFLIPSKLDGPSARYIIDLSIALKKNDIYSIISSESEACDTIKEEDLVNIKMPSMDDLDGFREYLDIIDSFKVDLVFSIGSRIKIDIILLYLKRMGLRCFKQFEDDEETIFLNCNKGSSKELYNNLLQKGKRECVENIVLTDVIDTKFNVIDPYIKGLTLSILDGYTKIWGGLTFDEEQYLCNLSFLSLPPVCSQYEIEQLKLEIKNVNNYEDIYFIGGSIYSKHDVDVFLSAWVEFKKIASNAKLYISYSRTAKNIISYLIEEYDGKYDINVIDLPSDEDYLDLLSKSKFILSIGGGKFDEKRLPSRLVKSLFLGKNVILPSVGFGCSLENKYNAFVCEFNDKNSWLSILTSSFEEKDNLNVGSNASRFAKENFDIDIVAKNFKRFISSESEILNRKSIENCMMADYIGIKNTDDKEINRQPIKRIKFRFVISNNKLFIQTLDRDDYSFQVDCSASALTNNEVIDTGFLFLYRFERDSFLDTIENIPLSGSELTAILKSFRFSFLDIPHKGRSAIFDKLVLAHMLYKVVTRAIAKFNIDLVFFHADMQPVEAVVSSLINQSSLNVKTVSLQHALFYSTNNECDVNIVNSRVSPSLYGLFWNDYVNKLVLKFNPTKISKNTQPIPSIRLKNLSKDKNREFLVILDGPNHKLYNDDLLNMCKELLKNAQISEIYVKAHPYHSHDYLSSVIKTENVHLIDEIDCVYNNVVFISSTLGFELHNANFSVYQFIPKNFDISILNEARIKKFKSIDCLGQNIKENFDKKLDVLSFLDLVKEYKNNFKNVTLELEKL